MSQIAADSPERSGEDAAGDGYTGAQTPVGSDQTPEPSRGDEKHQERSSKGPNALPLQLNPGLHPSARAIIQRAVTNWLRNTDVVELLSNWQEYGLQVSREPPNMPNGGTLYLFDKKRERYFRRDGHHWRKKPNGKTVRETHEKLKVDNKDVLNCYYTHSEDSDSLQRRCYWLLEGDEGIVLVHYLNAGQTRNRNGVAPVTKSGLGGSTSKGGQNTKSEISGPLQGWDMQPPPKEAWLDPNQLAGDPMQMRDRLNSFTSMPPPQSFVSSTLQSGAFARLPDLRSRQSTAAAIPNYSAFVPPQNSLFRAIDTAQAADRGKGAPASSSREGQENLTQRIAVENVHAGEMSEPFPVPWIHPTDASAETNSGDRSGDSQSPADPANENPGSQPDTERRKRRRRNKSGQEEETWGSGNNLDPSKTGLRHLADYFQQNTVALIEHLQQLRESDKRFWQDLLALERERIAAERDSFTAIAAAVVGHLTGLSSQAPPAGPPPPQAGAFAYRAGSGFPPGNRPRPGETWGDQTSVPPPTTRR